MFLVTPLVVMASFISGCVAFVEGVRVGRGLSPLANHMTWGAITLVLQFFAVCVATVHARQSERRIAELRSALVGPSQNQSQGDLTHAGASHEGRVPPSSAQW